MKKTVLFCVMLLLQGVADSLAAQDAPPAEKELKVMSFNIWVGGGKSVSRTFEVVKQSGADIVGIQESFKNGKNTAEQFAKDLGWHALASGGSPTIISRYPIVAKSAHKTGAKIRLGEKKYVWVFNIHLAPSPYGPYQLNGVKYGNAPFLTTEEEVVASSIKARGAAAERIIADIREAQKEGFPVFLTGDFNEPSCLDWTEPAAKAGKCKIPVKWPTTAAFQERAGMTDSYRKKFPDVVTHRGYSWTPRPAKKEVLDRIDFVFYHGDQVQVKNVQVIGEPGDSSDIKIEDYPSDHRAVLATFVVK
jgi:endonuclease/exonuclease/phosphatase family metal-dependent hydrolase